MSRIVPLALTACLGLAAASLSLPADAGVAVGIAVPGPAVLAPPVLVRPWPSVVVAPRYFRPGFVPYGVGPYAYRYGFRPGLRYGYWHRGWR